MASTFISSTVMSGVEPNGLSNATTYKLASTPITKYDVVPFKALVLVFILLSPLLVGSIRYFLFHDRPPKGLKLVPGPRSTIPYVGRVDIDADAPWHTMKKWADEYKGMFRLTMCGVMHIWLGDSDLAQEFFCKRAAKYSSRPEFFAVPGSHNQAQYLPLLEYGGESSTLIVSISPLTSNRPLASPTQVRTHFSQFSIQQSVLWLHDPGDKAFPVEALARPH